MEPRYWRGRWSNGKAAVRVYICGTLFAVKRLLLHLIAGGVSLVTAQSMDEITLKRPSPNGMPIAIGFLGAFERWNDDHRSVRKLALRLRDRGFQSESFSHRNLGTAKKAVMQSLDRNGDGKVDAPEAASAKVIIYGQSMGGAAAVKLAGYLKSKRVPVLLTVQVDSFGAHDNVIPANVRTAANFYQAHRMTVRGEHQIQAADPTRTRILGNFEYEYPIWYLHTWPESWPRRVFGGAHARMEADPVLWSRIESLVIDAAR